MFKKGFISSVPIAIGYIPVAITFGISATALGFDAFQTTLISLIVFAGSSQFVLISLMPHSFIYAIIIPLLLNMRHLVYSSIVSQKFKIKHPFITAFGLTDEVFAASASSNDERFIRGLELGAYLSWITGTLIGVFGGEFFLSSKLLTPSLIFSLTALFLVLLIPYLKGYHLFAVLIGAIIVLPFIYYDLTSIGILVSGLSTPVLVMKIENLTKK